jgi:hypothetical protein
VGRFRARTSGTREEEAFQQAVKEAHAALLRAQALCGTLRKLKGAGSQEGRKALTSARKLGQAITIVGDLGSFGPSFDSSDPDMMSDTARLALSKANREEQRRLRRSSSRGQGASLFGPE